MTNASMQDLLAWRGDELPRVGYLLGLRRFWMTDVYRRLRGEYERAVDPEAPPSTVDEAKPLVDGLPGLSLFLWLDGYVQTRLWAEVARFVDRRLEDARPLLAPRDGDRGRLELAEGFEHPSYYQAFDFHRQPGGIWRDERGALIYALGARVIHVGKNDAFELHDAFAAAIPEDDPARVLDLGCGFGKTTLSLRRRYPGAQVVGLDVSGPCLQLGRRLATEAGLDITWRQGAAEDVPAPDASFDVVTMTMLLHEMPLETGKATLNEAFRVLRPGGHLVALEPWVTGDPFRDLLGDYHSEVTGEPYIAPFRRSDVAAVCREVGFVDASIDAWSPPGAPAAGDVSSDRWASTWGLLTARKER